MIIPPSLQKGDKVAIVATAKRLETSYDQGVELIERWGFEPVVYESANAKEGYFAGTDTVRINDFQNALNDNEIKAILFLRGGYGSTRLLDQIDFSNYRENPKWLIGFSDITSILLQSIQEGVASIHGPVAITLGRDSKSDENLLAILEGRKDFEYPLTPSDFTNTGTATGRIVGGNLCMVCDSIGTSNEIQTEGNILLIEEIGEEYYAIDRMLTKLKRAGKLKDLTGVILGSFTSISDRQSYYNQSLLELITSFFIDLNIPIATGLDAGHEHTNYPLIFGAFASVDIKRDSIGISYIKEENLPIDQQV